MTTLEVILTITNVASIASTIFVSIRRQTVKESSDIRDDNFREIQALKNNWKELNVELKTRVTALEQKSIKDSAKIFDLENTAISNKEKIKSLIQSEHNCDEQLKEVMRQNEFIKEELRKIQG